MSMIDIFKDTLQKGMVITNCKELSNRYKITLMYEGMEGTCELNKMCVPNSERALCRKAIDTAISGMYINIGNLLEAKAWLNGERWTDEETKAASISKETRETLEDILEKIDCDVWSTLDDDGDDWFTAEKISQIKDIIESYLK